MTPTEANIWQQFATANLDPKAEVYFETPIQPMEPDAHYKQDPELSWWEKITALKADVLWRTTEGWNLAEVEELLTMEAIGQAICYRELWNELNPEMHIKRTWVITAGDDPRLHAALRAATLEHYLVNALP